MHHKAYIKVMKVIAFSVSVVLLRHTFCRISRDYHFILKIQSWKIPELNWFN